MKKVLCGILMFSILFLVGCSQDVSFDPNAARITAAEVAGDYQNLSFGSVDELYNELSMPAGEAEVAMTLSGDPLKYKKADGTTGDCTIKVESVYFDGTDEWVHTGNYLVNAPTLMSNMVGQRPGETKNDFSFVATIGGEECAVALTKSGECTIACDSYEVTGTYVMDGEVVVLTLSEGTAIQAPAEGEDAVVEETPVEGEEPVVDTQADVTGGQVVRALYFYEANVYTNVMKLIPKADDVAEPTASEEA